MNNFLYLTFIPECDEVLVWEAEILYLTFILECDEILVWEAGEM